MNGYGAVPEYDELENYMYRDKHMDYAKIIDDRNDEITKLKNDIDIRDKILRQVNFWYKDNPLRTDYEFYSIIRDIVELLNPKPQWWDDIPACGVLCWVGDYEFDFVGNNIRIIMKKDDGVFHTSVGGSWKHAEPLTKDEIMEFLK